MPKETHLMTLVEFERLIKAEVEEESMTILMAGPDASKIHATQSLRDNNPKLTFNQYVALSAIVCRVIDNFFKV